VGFYKVIDSAMNRHRRRVQSQPLAEWLHEDKGNISRKLHGNEAITRNDLRDVKWGSSN
jgi:hypothetical protein